MGTVIEILKETEKNLLKQIEEKKKAYTNAKWELKSAEKALANIQKQLNDISTQSAHG